MLRRSRRASDGSCRHKRATAVVGTIDGEVRSDAPGPAGPPNATGMEECDGMDERSDHDSARVPMVRIDTSKFGMPEAPPSLRVAAVGTDRHLSDLKRSYPATIHVADWGPYTVTEPTTVLWPAPEDLAGVSEIVIIIGAADERPEIIEVRFFDATTDPSGEPVREPISAVECDLITETCKTVLSAQSLGVIVPLPRARGEYKLAIWAKWQDWPVWRKSVDDGNPIERQGYAAWLFSLIK